MEKEMEKERKEYNNNELIFEEEYKNGQRWN